MRSRVISIQSQIAHLQGIQSQKNKASSYLNMTKNLDQTLTGKIKKEIDSIHVPHILSFGHEEGAGAPVHLLRKACITAHE